MIKFITWLVVTLIVIAASDSYFELLSRPYLTPVLIGGVSFFYIIMVVAYGYYCFKLLQEVLNINNQPKKEEEQ